MVKRCRYSCLSIVLLIILPVTGSAQQAGGIRGIIYDQDFDVPLPQAEVLITETGDTVLSTDQGNYVFPQVQPGRYTLVFSKPGFTRQVKADVIVTAGQLTEINMWMTGDFVDMEEFVVQDVSFGTGTEAALLELRMDSPALMDSISAELMSQAGASDAADALTLVSGASVQDGKFAVIRGLPDRYVNSQLNGVRLPSADADTRAVELDQFPSDVIESIQVTKTFTPDQQGDASGGAVNVMLKSIPEETLFKISAGTELNTQVVETDEFLTYQGGGIDVFGKDGDLGIPADGEFGGAVGTMPGDTPFESNFDISAGGRHELDNGVKIGGFANIYYERDATFVDDRIDDEKWVDSPGEPMTPQYIQGTPQQGDFKTQLFDVIQGSEQVQWGGLGIVGVEFEDHSFSLSNLFTRVAEDTATLAEDTRGKEFFFPGHDPDDPTTPGHGGEIFAAPFLRNETLQYMERTTRSHQLNAKHTLPDPGFGFGDWMTWLQPEIDWTLSYNLAERVEPDKRQFSSFWTPERVIQFGDQTIVNPPKHNPFKPAENFTLGNFQRTWEEIEEDSRQFSVNFKFPYEQWNGEEGYVKVGAFFDDVQRTFDQETFSNFSNNEVELIGDFEDSFSQAFPDLPTAGEITGGPPFVDVDYEGEQQISAGYGMMDLPLNSQFKWIGGARYETTQIGIVNFPEQDVTWIPPGSSGQVTLNEGDADVNFERQDLLPSIGFVYTPLEELTLRSSYTQTVARQTFKELSPIQQQEFLGGDVFIGNPFLDMAELQNYDLRIDYVPYQGGLISASYFYKDIKDPIEFVQRFAGFTFTTPVNYPKGEMSGFEFELRQELGYFWENMEGLSIGSNATFIDSEVTLPADEAAQFELPNIQAPMPTRDMTNAPEHLFNFFVTYNWEDADTQFGLFYTIRGDTLVAGAGQSSGNFIPNVYELEFGNLNASITKKFGENWSVKFQAKNITNPKIQTAYRSRHIGDDVLKSSYRKGMDFSISVSATF